MICRNGDCIPEHEKCDGKKDCVDESDEIGCQDNADARSDANEGRSNSKCLYIFLLFLMVLSGKLLLI